MRWGAQRRRRACAGKARVVAPVHQLPARVAAVSVELHLQKNHAAQRRHSAGFRHKRGAHCAAEGPAVRSSARL